MTKNYFVVFIYTNVYSADALYYAGFKLSEETCLRGLRVRLNHSYPATKTS